MNGNHMRILRWTLRPLGALLLAGAYDLGHFLVSISAAVPADQPPLVYLLSPVAFAFFSAGAALLLEGHHLFDRIRVSDRWVSHAPPMLEDSRWSAQSPQEPAPHPARSLVT